MSTKISIQIGALTAERTFANDTKASATLLAFYTANNLGPADATNRQKLEAIVDWVVDHVRAKAIVRHIEDGRATVEDEAKAAYGFE